MTSKFAIATGTIALILARSPSVLAQGKAFVIRYDTRTNQFLDVVEAQVETHVETHSKTPRLLTVSNVEESTPRRFQPGFVFQRGDDIYVQFVNAKFDTEFQLGITPEELPQPDLAPVFGSDVEIKPVSAFQPLFTHFRGASVTAQAGGAQFIDVFRANLLASTEFEKYLTEFLDTRLDNDDVARAALIPVDPLIHSLSDEVPATIKRLNDHRTRLENLQNTVAGYNPPTVGNVFECRQEFNERLRERDKLVNSVEFSLLESDATTFGQYQELMNKPAVAELTSFNVDDLNSIVGVLDAGVIAAVGDKWNAAGLKASENSFLKELGNTYPEAVNEAGTRIRDNLRVALRYRGQLESLRDLVNAVTARTKSINAYLESEQSLVKLRDAINKVNSVTANLGVDINSVPSKAPYQPEVIRVGEWFANKRIKLTINRRKRLRDYNLAAITGTLLAPTQAGGAQSGDTTVSELLVDEFKMVNETHVDVHQLYRFRIAAGFLYSHLPDREFEVMTRAVDDPSGALDDDGNPKKVDENFLVQTKDRSSRIVPTVQLNIFFKERDFHPGYVRTPAFGVSVGFSLVEPTESFLFTGLVDLTPWLSLTGGVQVGLVQQQPEGLDPGGAIPATEVITIREEWNVGGVVGATLDAKLFVIMIGGLFGK